MVFLVFYPVIIVQIKILHSTNTVSRSLFKLVHGQHNTNIMKQANC